MSNPVVDLDAQRSARPEAERSGLPNPPTGNASSSPLSYFREHPSDEDDAMDREYIDAKMEGVSARHDKAFNEAIHAAREAAAEVRTIEARIDTRLAEMTGKLASLPSTLTLFGAIFTGCAAVLGIIIATWVLSSDRLDAGVAIGRALSDASADVEERINARFDQLDEQIRLIAATRQEPPALPAPVEQAPAE